MVCVLLLLPAPLMVLYDRVRPWPLAVARLAESYPSQSRFCVAASSYEFWNDGRSLALVSRSYVLFPRALFHPVTVTVMADESGKTKVEESLLLWFAPVVALSGVALLVLALKLLQMTGLVAPADRSAGEPADRRDGNAARGF